MAWHARYWSCSKFADWIRGEPKPIAATMPEWREWKNRVKSSQPVRYWLAETALGKIQDIVALPSRMIRELQIYISNRWIIKSHALTAYPDNIKPGTWRDLSDRILPCLFDELVNFVESEAAWHYAVFDKEKYKTPNRFFGIDRWRSAQAGIDYLKWASELKFDESGGVDPDDELYGKLTPQAIAAQEILKLYFWYTQVYRNRPDPMDASGWSEYCELKRSTDESYFGDSSLGEDGTAAYRKLEEIEKQYDQEDEEMLIRLIKIRQSLWT